LSLDEYQQQTATRNEVIIKTYQSGGYTMKQIGDYFEVHYSLISRIVAASKK
jgi:putative transposase